MRIFNLQGNLLGIFEQFESCNVTHDFYGISIITIDLFKGALYSELLTDTNIIELDILSKKSYFLLEDVVSTESTTETLKVTGRTYGLFPHRIIKGQDEQEDHAETVMKYYVETLTGNRAIPNLTVQADEKRGEVVKYPGNNQYISTMLESIGWQTGLGWDVVLTNKQLEFRVLEGTDRPVKLKKEFGNLKNVHWEYILSKSKTVAYVGDDGTGAGRTLDEFGTATGIHRREIFLNGRNTDAQGRLSLGETALEELKAERSIEVEYNFFEPFLFNRDFFLGDRITFVGDDFTINAQVIRAIERIDRRGTTLKLVLNKKTLNFVDLFKTDINNLSVEARI